MQRCGHRPVRCPKCRIRRQLRAQRRDTGQSSAATFQAAVTKRLERPLRGQSGGLHPAFIVGQLCLLSVSRVRGLLRCASQLGHAIMASGQIAIASRNISARAECREPSCDNWFTQPHPTPRSHPCRAGVSSGRLLRHATDRADAMPGR